MDSNLASHPAALRHARTDVLSLDRRDLEDDPTVVEHDPVADRDVGCEPLVRDRNLFFVAFSIPFDEREVGPRRELEGAVEGAGPDLRTAEILQDRDRLLLGFARFSKSREPRTVLGVGAVREVEARDVHSGVDQRLQAFDRITRRPQRADELRTTNRHARTGSIHRGIGLGKPCHGGVR
jgi:hypothetical protein